MNARRRLVVLTRMLLAMALSIGLLRGSVRPARAASQIDIPGPAGSGVFGTSVTVLPNGNFVVTDPKYDGGIGAEAGAVHLYNGASGARISTLTGMTTGDQVGSGGVTVLSSGDYVVSSMYWDNGAAADAGAVTWGSATAGVSGSVSSGNSLVGSTANDQVGSGGVTPLSSGGYVVSSPNWDNGGAADAGAVTWGSATGGVSGPVSSSNSLVGSTANDQVGYDVTALSNGGYVVSSPNWDNGGSADAGAVTWGSGTSGVSGTVSALNSLVGSTVNDLVGSGGVTPLSDGDYVVSSPIWDNGGSADAGAATWGSGTSGASGTVSAVNSLVGSKTGDQVGFNVDALSDEDYVVSSPYWDNGAAAEAGAVTWGNGAGGIAGVVSAANSLVGGTAGDLVGYWGVTPLNDGDYVVRSVYWDDGGTADAGAATWGSGTGGVSGLVSAANSLVGDTASDRVGSGGVTALSDGDYVVSSPNWNNSGTANAGAVTWGSGTGGVSGTVSALNSLVGGTADDLVGYPGVRALNDGDYVVSSCYWDNGGATSAGAVTWGNGAGGIAGVVSAANSLVGGTAGDLVGYWGVTPLSDGNYVVRSPYWGNGAATDAGAATWGDGAGGIAGVVSAANSLVGGTAGDRVGYGGVTALSDGDYVVSSPDWNNSGAANAGAATWGSETGGVSGTVSALNSLVGSTADDQVGIEGVTTLSNGSYVVRSPWWDHSGTLDAGAVTWSFGASRVIGPITTLNSVLGTAASGGDSMVFDYDAVNHQLVVGRPADNIVTLFRLVYGVTVTPAAGAKSGAPGAAVSYTLAVHNTSDTTETFNVTASGDTWTTTLPASVGPIAAGASQNLAVGVTVPASAAGGSTDAVTITVTSQADNTKTDTAILTTTASNVYGVAVTPPTSARSGAPGAAVSYTLAVQNTGNTAASFNLAASGDSWTTTLPATVGPIAAGASQNVTVSVTVPGSAAGGSTDAVTITVTSQADNTKKDTAVLTTTAGNVYGVAVTPPTSARSGAPGAAVSYTLAVQNTGNASSSFNLAASGGAWTTTLPATVGPIAAGASQDVTVNVTIPASAAGGSTDAVTITVTSQADGSKKDTAVLTTTASNVYGVTVTSATRMQSGMPGATVSYTLAITNTGNTAANFTLAASAHDWTTTFPATLGPINPGASQPVTVNVSVPASAPGGDTDSVTITAVSQADPAKTDTAVLTTSAGNVYGVTVTPATSAGSGLPGAVVTFTLQVANTGNTAAIFNLALSGDDWTTSLPATVGPIDPGASQNVTISVTVPASAIGGTTDTVTITATSQADGSKQDTAVLTTTAANRKIYMPIMCR